MRSTGGRVWPRVDLATVGAVPTGGLVWLRVGLATVGLVPTGGRVDLATVGTVSSADGGPGVAATQAADHGRVVTGTNSTKCAVEVCVSLYQRVSFY